MRLKGEFFLTPCSYAFRKEHALRSTATSRIRNAPSRLPLDALNIRQSRAHFLQQDCGDSGPIDPFAGVSRELGVVNNIPFDVAQDEAFGHSQANIIQGRQTIAEQEATLEDAQIRPNIHTWPAGAGVYSGHDRLSACNVDPFLGNAQPFFATDTANYYGEDTAFNFAEATPQFIMNNNIQTAPYHQHLGLIQPGVSGLSANFETPGLRQLVPQPAMPSATGSAPQPRTQRQTILDCDVPGCDATFKRLAEFRRHKDTIHQQGSTPRFRCMVQSCRYTYPRLDKVREHMKRMHGICLSMDKA